MESDEDSDSPDSIVPASSPESILGEEAPRFPQLGSGRWEQDTRALSPVIPIIPRASIPGMCCCWHGQAQGGWVVRSQGLNLHKVLSFSHPVFPDTKPYGTLDLEVPGKLPATAWEKGKGSEVSVMLTVSAAAAKVCPRGGGTLRPRRTWIRRQSLKLVLMEKKFFSIVQIFVLSTCFV